MLVVGPHPIPLGWDMPGRLRLVDNLTVLVGQLHQVGIMEIYIAGSFVQDKPDQMISMATMSSIRSHMRRRSNRN